MAVREYQETIKVVADILAKFMTLSQDRIFLANDGRELPKDEGLYLVISIASRSPYASKSEQKSVGGAMREVLTMNVAERLVVSICSKNSDARLRCHEVQMAMASQYAEQMQELYGFHISRMANVNDRSFLEATARLNRFDCEINTLTCIEKVQDIDYFDTFEIEDKFNP